jgi:pimeloyl-ACP methyl ester carboxylesterase
MRPTRDIQESIVYVGTREVALEGTLSVPDSPRGIILFAHGSGSSRHSPRNRFVARELQNGGRPDLAGDALPRVRTPTLFVVGGNDEQVIELSEQAMARMPGPVRLEIVPGATHLFEEAGTLEQVARLARDWFVRHLSVMRTTDARVEGDVDRADRSEHSR